MKERPVAQEMLRTIRDFAYCLGAIVSFFIAVLTLSQIFDIKAVTGFFGGLGLTGIYLLAVHTTLVSLIWVIAKSIARRNPQNLNVSGKMVGDSETRLSGELHAQIRKLFDAGDYTNVVRIGSQLSRPLWLSQRNNERIAIGWLVEEAASRTGDIEEQVTALIDDVGWTNVVIGNFREAEQNITNGVAKAKNHQLWHMAAKGERHLAAICIQCKEDMAAAKIHLNEALENAAKIPDQYQREQQIASIVYAQAHMSLASKDFSTALSLAVQSKTVYQNIGGQEDRLVKSQSLLGRIYMGLGQTQNAIDAFREGLTLSERYARNDEKAENLMGLGDLFLASQEYSKAIRNYDEAAKIFDESDLKQSASKAVAARTRAEQEWKQVKPKIRK